MIQRASSYCTEFNLKAGISTALKAFYSDDLKGREVILSVFFKAGFNHHLEGIRHHVDRGENPVEIFSGYFHDYVQFSPAERGVQGLK